jgi:hypothetical protein
MRRLLVFCLLLIVSSLAYAQARAVEKGSVMISLTGTFSKTSGDLFVMKNSSMIESDVQFFGVKNIAVGGVLQYQRISGDDLKIKRMNVGPVVGYYFGDLFPNMIPFLSASLLFNTIKLDDNPEVNRSQGIASCGVIFAATDNIGFEVKLSYRNILEESETGTLALGIGLTGFLF